MQGNNEITLITTQGNRKKVTTVFTISGIALLLPFLISTFHLIIFQAFETYSLLEFHSILFNSPELGLIYKSLLVVFIAALVYGIILAKKSWNASITVTDKRIYGVDKSGKYLEIAINDITMLETPNKSSVVISAGELALNFSNLLNAAEVADIINQLQNKVPVSTITDNLTEKTPTPANNYANPTYAPTQAPVIENPPAHNPAPVHESTPVYNTAPARESTPVSTPVPARESTPVPTPVPAFESSPTINNTSFANTPETNPVADTPGITKDTVSPEATRADGSNTVTDSVFDDDDGISEDIMKKFEDEY